MANVKILVMRDGETWDIHDYNNSAKIMEIAEEDYQKLCAGEVGIYELDVDGKIISEKHIKEDDGCE